MGEGNNWMVKFWKSIVCTYLFIKSWPKRSLWLMSAKTKIFICAEKVPIVKFPLMTPAILVFDEFTARTVSCSVGSSSSLS